MYSVLQFVFKGLVLDMTRFLRAERPICTCSVSLIKWPRPIYPLIIAKCWLCIHLFYCGAWPDVAGYASTYRDSRENLYCFYKLEKISLYTLHMGHTYRLWYKEQWNATSYLYISFFIQYIYIHTYSTQCTVYMYSSYFNYITWKYITFGFQIYTQLNVVNFFSSKGYYASTRPTEQTVQPSLELYLMSTSFIWPLSLTCLWSFLALFIFLLSFLLYKDVSHRGRMDLMISDRLSELLFWAL